MKNICFSSLLIFAILATACTKSDDDITESEPEVMIPETTDSTTFISNTYNTVITGWYYEAESYAIDIDNDGRDDLLFRSETVGSPFLGQIPMPTIECLHSNIQIYTYENIDSIFQHIYNIEKTNIDSTFYQTTTINHVCLRYNSEDSVSIHNSIKINPLDEIDLTDIDSMVNLNFYNDDNYTSSKFQLYEGSFNYTRQDSIIGDTTYSTIGSTRTNCTQFPQDEEKYIVIRFINRPRLGWIKIMFTQSRRIHIYESNVVE